MRGPASLRRIAAALVGLGALGLATGCGGSGEVGAQSAGRTLTVFAAASLTEPFTTIGKEFESRHPGVQVAFSFGASSDLATQVREGAPAEVLATASTATMDQVREEVTDRADFATNSMEIVVPAGNPAGVTGLADLARRDVKVAVCQAEVPCGTVATEVFDNAGLTVHPVTEEADVRAVLTKVGLGEVDAGMVYVSDVRTAGDAVTGVPIPADVNAVTTYPIAVVADAVAKDLARRFAAMVLGPVGREALADAGFAAP